MNLNVFPPVSTPRTLYVQGLEPELCSELESRGYTVVELMTMPRHTPEEQRTYLMAKSQAVEEGTVVIDDVQERVLKAQMKAMGMLDHRSLHLNANINVPLDAVEQMLGWGKDRHTLAGNSTAIFARTPDKGAIRERLRKTKTTRRGKRGSRLQQAIRKGSGESDPDTQRDLFQEGDG